MNDKPRQPARSNQRRSSAGLRGTNDLSATITTHLANDPLWGHFSHSGAWICPFCLSAVRGHEETRVALVRAIEGHLARRCTAYKEGHGHPQPATIIGAKRSHEDIAYFALTNPAWQVFDHEGFWYSPCSLQRVGNVRIANGRFDSFTIQNMVMHLNSCPHYQRGVVHPVEAVQRARDQALRAVNLTTNLRQLVQFPLWRYADTAGRWVCPFCLGHIDGVPLGSPEDWTLAPERMAEHLAFACTAYVPERPEPRTEAQVQHSAGGGEPAAKPTGTQGWRTPTNLYPMPTGGGTPRHAPVATPVNAGPRIAPRAPGTSGGNPVAPRAPGQSGGNPIAPRAPGHSGGNPVAPRSTGSSPSIPARPAARAPGTASGPIAMPPVARPVSGASPIVPTSPVVPERAVVGTTSRVAVPISQPAGRQPQHPTPPPAEPPPEVPVAIDGEDDDDDSGAAPVLDWMDVVESTQDSTPPQGHDSERIRARDIQKGLLTDAPEIEGFQFATRFEACEDVSGDFYEFISLPDGRLGFAQGDVSGHGLHAGLIMSMAKKTLAIFAEAGHGPSETLTKVNDSLAADLGGKIFISMIYAILDPHERTITWSRAGHNPVIRFNTKTGALTEIKPKGMVVGMKAGQVFRKSIADETTTVESGDLFILYTDGITETMNRQQLEYGTELLREVVQKHAEGGVEVVLERIMDSVRQFRGGTVADDDLTLLALAVD